MVYGNRRNFLNNLSITHKKIAIFGFLIGLFLVVYGVNYRAFQIVEQNTNEKIIITEMLEDFLEARLASVGLRAGKSFEDSVEKVETNIAELDSDARAQVSGTIPDPEARSALLGVIDGAVRYGERFATAAAVQQRLEGELTRIETMSNDLRVEMDRLVDAAIASGDAALVRAAYGIERNLTEGRILAERFLWRENPERLRGARDAFAAASRAVEALQAAGAHPAVTAAAERLLQRIDALGRLVSSAADLTRERTTIFIGELDELGPRLTEGLEAVMAGRYGTGAEGDLINRMAALQQTLLAVSSVAIVLALLACYLLIRAVVRPLRALTERLRAVADGDTDFVVRQENSLDEMGTMWTALGKLRTTVETAYARAQIIDQLPNPVIVADPRNELGIAYANDAARSLFASMRETAAEDLVGQPLQVVTGDRTDARAILRDPARLPWRTRIAYANGEHVDLKAVAVRDRRGGYVGAMLALRRVTDQVRSTNAFETNIKATVEQISSTFSQMRDRIETIAMSAADSQGRLSEGSEAVTEATASVQMVASAAEELSSSITEIASRLAESTRRASDASRSTADVAQRAKELAAVSKRITEVVKTISDIAEKTNLLALNATIEAASAGAAGKGFAVVAAEVKNLANQTAKATDEVSQEMAAIQGQIRTVTEGITAVADVIEEINGVFASISAAAEEQQAATREITMNAQNAAGGTETAARSIRVITDTSAGNLDATRDLTRAARELAEANDNLARQSDAFLSTMKTSA